MGKIEKGVRCSVKGCRKRAVRSLSAEKVISAGVEVGESRRAYLCEDHYKEFKRKSKKAKLLEKWRHMG